MASATLNLWSIEHYMTSIGSSIFDDMILPSGIDADLLQKNILIKSEPYESLYYDGDMIKYYVGIWSQKWYRTFDKWYDAMQLEYDPISNYDRHETWTESGNRTEKENNLNTTNSNGTTSTDSTGTNSSSGSETHTDTTTNKVSAFNASTFQNDSQSETTGNSSNNNVDTNNSRLNTTNNDSVVNSGSNDKSSSDTNVRTGRAWGNIGVTTNAQMLEEHLSLVEWNLYEHITDLFLNEFVIPVF